MTRLPDDDLLADQYVLNLLDTVEYAQTAQRVADDRDFAKLVAAAARCFQPLDDTATPMPLPDGAWERLEARLGAAARPMATVAQADGQAANHNRSPWRLIPALAATVVLTAGLTWAVLQRLPLSGHTDTLAMAVLLDPGGVPFAVVEDFGGGAVAVTALARYQVPKGQSLQAWTKWSDAVGPVSVGVLDAFTSAPLQADGMPQPLAGQLYEITLEQQGGSPTGRPTGPVLGIGRASIPN